MLNAEDIILLEKKWFRFKIKQKIKFLLFLFVPLVFFVLFYLFFLFNPLDKPQVNSNVIVAPIAPKISASIEPSKSPITNDSNLSKNYVAIIPDVNKTISKPLVLVENIVENKVDSNTTLKYTTSQEESKFEYHLKIVPTLKTNDLFSSSGTVTFHSPLPKSPTIPQVSPVKPIEVAQVVESQKEEAPKEKPISIEPKPKKTINISTEEVDTITYLKEKFYSTENVVFAIMLSEELYNKKDYEESIKWALTANEIDSKNDKSWFWFAKNKVQLNQKDDAIKAIKAFLAENSSTRLKTLLKEIESGDK